MAKVLSRGRGPAHGCKRARVADQLGFVIYVEQQRCGQRLDKRFLQHGHVTAGDVEESKVLGPSMLDEALATIVTHLVEQRGVGARAEQVDALSMSRILSWDTTGVELICLCYLEAATAAQIRYAIRRIRRRIPDVSIIVASLGRPMSVEDDEASTAGAESVQNSLRATVDKIMAVALTQSEVKTSVRTPVALVS